MTLEIRNEKLVIDDVVIGDEDYVVDQFEKAVKYDKIMAATKGGDA
jgi:hypothetical protein